MARRRSRAVSRAIESTFFRFRTLTPCSRKTFLVCVFVGVGGGDEVVEEEVEAEVEDGAVEDAAWESDGFDDLVAAMV